MHQQSMCLPTRIHLQPESGISSLVYLQAYRILICYIHMYIHMCIELIRKAFSHAFFPLSIFGDLSKYVFHFLVFDF